MDISTKVSQKFRFVSTLSMIAVVFIHAKFIMSRWDASMDMSTRMGRVSDIVQFIISEQICRLAVPLFFLISGFFMAYHNDGSIKTYLNKVQNRIKSLLVPYLLFSAIWLVVSILTGRVEFNNNITNIIHYVFISPIPFQFWFLQHLIVLVFASIILYHLIKRFGISTIVGLGIIYVLDNNLHTGFGASLFFYGLGIFLCMKPFHIKHCNFFFVAFIFLLGTCALMRFAGIDLCNTMVALVSKVMILCGVCRIILWICDSERLFNFPEWLPMSAGTSFFIFCVHEPLLSYLKSTFLQVFFAQWQIFIGYFVLPITVIMLCLIVDCLIRKTNIKLYRFLTGGR